MTTQDPSTAGKKPRIQTARHSEVIRVPGARHLALKKGLPLWVKITAGSLAVVLLGVIAFGAYWYIRLNSNLKTAPITASTNGSKNNVNNATDALQILIMGTDSRDGTGDQYGGEGASSGIGNSDVNILLDISADNSRVNVISFPRDLVVPIPACKNPKTGKVSEAVPAAQLNSAMSFGGPGCTVDTINKLTGLQIDHFMLVNFNSVKELSNEVGGVEVCVNAAIDDPDSGLKLPAGKSTVQGEQALAFLRNRHGVGDGSDITRIKSQQQFLASLARKVRADGTLGNLPKLLNIADTVTKNVTVDPDLASPQTLITIAQRLQKVDLNKVVFATIPWEPAEINPEAWVQPKNPDASQLFKALREGVDLTNPTKPVAKPSATPTATPTAGTTTQPATTGVDQSQAPVTVANGTAVPGRAEEINTFLAAKKLIMQPVIEADNQDTTYVYYSADYAAAAKSVAAALNIPAAQIQPSKDIVGVQVYLGADFTSGTSYQQVQLPKDIVGQTANQQTCQSAYIG